MRVAAVVLAAGASSRLGRPKALIEIDGEPLVVKSASCALDAGCAPVVVVMGADADRIEPNLSCLDVRVRRNPEWRQGMSTSVRAGVEALGDPASVIERSPSMVWRYTVKGCALDLFFYLDLGANAFRVLAYEMKARTSSDGATLTCLGRIRAVADGR